MLIILLFTSLVPPRVAQNMSKAEILGTYLRRIVVTLKEVSVEMIFAFLEGKASIVQNFGIVIVTGPTLHNLINTTHESHFGITLDLHSNSS